MDPSLRSVSIEVTNHPNPAFALAVATMAASAMLSETTVQRALSLYGQEHGLSLIDQGKADARLGQTAEAAGSILLQLSPGGTPDHPLHRRLFLQTATRRLRAEIP